LGLALLAAVIHASWNVVVKTSDNPLRALAWAMAAVSVVLLPPAAAIWWLAGRPGLPVEAWLLVGISAILETIYVTLLSEAYQRGELSIVYPIARGTAPLLAVAAGLLLLGERLTPLQLVGVTCLLAGIWAVRRPAEGPAVRLAIITGITIGAYSVIDRVGVRLGPSLLYSFALMVITTVLVMAWARWRGDLGIPPENWLRSLTLGIFIWPGYFLVLVAYSLAPVSVISPVRESAVVLVSVWGIWQLKERRGAGLRLAGAVAVVAGITLLALAGS